MALHKLLDRVVGYASTTDGTTWVTIITYTPPEESVCFYIATFIGKEVIASTPSGVIIHHLGGSILKNATTTSLLIGSTTLNHASAGLANANSRLTFSGGNILFEILGDSGNTIEWMCDLKIQVI